MPVLIQSTTVVVGTVAAIALGSLVNVIQHVIVSGSVLPPVGEAIHGVNLVAKHTARELYLALVIIHVTVPVH